MTAECAVGRGHSSEQPRQQRVGEMARELGVNWRTTEFVVVSRRDRCHSGINAKLCEHFPSTAEPLSENLSGEDTFCEEQWQ